MIGGGNRPNPTGPGTPNPPVNPGINPNQPGVVQPGVVQPGQPGRPGEPGTIGGTTRPTPTGPVRPGQPVTPGVNPGQPGRPTQPGIAQPGIAQPGPGQPGIGQPGRPGMGNRPGTIVRPGQPGGGVSPLPTGPQRPDRPNRPERPERPVVTRPRPPQPPTNVNTNVNNVTNITNNNININTNVNNWGNRPGNGWWGGRPSYKPFGSYWHDTHVHSHHYSWYQGAWGGPWAAITIGPFAWGLLGGGNANFLYSSGYVQYVNPYCGQTVIVDGIDYSRPIVIQPVVQVEQPAQPGVPAPQPVAEPGLAEFDQALALFRAGDYPNAKTRALQALRQRPGDPAAHEFYALCLFATGEYQSAAGVLNALLASSPGWDWATMSKLYGEPGRYTPQLRALEDVSKAQPDNVAVQFLLGYHYLVCGHPENALKKFNRVKELQPRDLVSAQLAKALEQGQAQAQVAAATPPGTPVTGGIDPVPPELQPQTKPAQPEPETKPAPGDTTPEEAAADDFFDLVGTWIAELPQGGNVILTISEESGFTWLVEPKGGESRTIAGTLGVDGDALLLDSPEEGTMTGSAVVKGPNTFSFVLQGGPPGDPGLTFQRRGEPRGPGAALPEDPATVDPTPVDPAKVIEQELQPEPVPTPEDPAESPKLEAPK